MTSSVKSGAALRLRRSAEASQYGDAAETGASPASHETIRENLYRFPSIGIPPHRPATPAAQPEEPSLARLDDLAAELEAALMNDLNQLAPFWGDEAPAIPPARPGQLRLPLGQDEPGSAAPESKADVPHSDRLAVELLLARGRAAAPAPQPVAVPVADKALEESLAGELAERLSAAVDELKVAEGEPTGADLLLEEPRSERRIAFNRPLVALAAVTLLVAGGALITVQSLTAHSGPSASADVDAGLTTASVLPAEAPPQAVATKQSYERAAKDDALVEAPQLRGTDLMLPATLSPHAGSAGGTAPVDPSVRAAYAMPAPVAETAPAAAPVTAEADAAAPVAASTADNTPAPAAVAPAEPAPKLAQAKPVEVKPVEAAVAAEPARPAASVADLQAGAARITSGVRLRGNPDNGAPTVGYLKPGAEVQVVQCKGWCEVVAGDKRGFVYKRFLAAL
ncbi:SH3 domain-containing protein [Kaistia adipata]|uniref:SH3 domain-containing protein n=1 Tax=Kaistia adipata TaxID=166954 RepID=UPI000420A315|nr:SH3 domain-containing protein [Kaistia adipata]